MPAKNRGYGMEIYSGVAAFLIFLVAIFVTTQNATSFQNWYTTNEYFSWTTMAISHLGVSSLAVPFTIVILIVSALVIRFALAVKQAYEGHRISSGVSLIIYGYIALMATFISLLYNPNSTATIAVHFATAIVYFVLPPIGMMLIGMDLIAHRKVGLGNMSIFLGLLAFIFGPIICFGSSIFLGNKGVAIPELLQILCEGLWVVLMTADMLRKRG